MQRQREFRKPRAQILQELLGLGFVLESQHSVIRITNDDHVTARMALTPLLRPEIENVMEVDISQQGRNQSMDTKGNLYPTYFLLPARPREEGRYRHRLIAVGWGWNDEW